MSRSGYGEDCEYPELYRHNVEQTIRSKRGQSLLRELAVQMDAMPEKILIEHELVNESGQCCTLGVVFKARGIDVSTVDESEPYVVAGKLGINHMMAAEIAYMNDEYGWEVETQEQRWTRMRKWVDENLIKEEVKP